MERCGAVWLYACSAGITTECAGADHPSRPSPEIIRLQIDPRRVSVQRCSRCYGAPWARAIMPAVRAGKAERCRSGRLYACSAGITTECACADHPLCPLPKIIRLQIGRAAFSYNAVRAAAIRRRRGRYACGARRKKRRDAARCGFMPVPSALPRNTPVRITGFRCQCRDRLIPACRGEGLCSGRTPP